MLKREEFEWKDVSSLCASLNGLAISIVLYKTRRAAAATLTESAADVTMPPDVMLNSKGRTRVRSGRKEGLESRAMEAFQQLRVRANRLARVERIQVGAVAQAYGREGDSNTDPRTTMRCAIATETTEWP
jgi:hypothetical protein